MNAMRTKLPTTCPYCLERDRPRFQAMCPPCSRRFRVAPTKGELRVAQWAEYHLARQLDKRTRTLTASAVLRLQQRKILTADERTTLGLVLRAYGIALDQIGYAVPEVDSLYHKLMGHDRHPTCRRDLRYIRHT